MVGALAGELAVDGVGYRQIGLVDLRARHGAALQQQDGKQEGQGNEA
jgi:hypothetical protein